VQPLSKEHDTNHDGSSTNEWKLFIDSIEDYGMFMLDLEGRVRTWNRGAQKMNGYAPAEIIGRHFSTFYPAADIAAGKPARELAEAIEHGRVEDEGFRLRKDGTRFWANVIITTLRDDRGQPRGFAKVTRDLTARLRHEEDLRRSDERFRLLVDSVRDYAIFMLDPSGRVATWNLGAQAIKGYRAEEIIGKHFSTFYPPHDLAAGKPEWELEVAIEQGRVEDEGWRVRKDGSLFWASVVITALRDARGELFGFAKVTRDLSARRAWEEALRRSEERFRLLIDSVVDYAMYMLDPTGKVTTWNHGAEKLKGYSAREVIGRNFAMFFPEQDRLAGKPEKELKVAVEQGRFEEEGYRARKDGSLFWANVVLTPMRDSSGQLLGFAKVTRDLTARAEAERIARELVREQAARAAAQEAEAQVRAAAESAARAAAQAAEAGRLKDEFLATVSHELRTPLNAIVGWSSLLTSRTSEASILKGLNVIHRNAIAQARIVDDILDVSRVIAGKLRLELALTDLLQVVKDAMEVLRPACEAREITMELSASEGEYRLMADADRLQQVVWNLLSNAVKFSKKRGSIRLRVETFDSSYALTVEDDGQGIAPEFLPFVFERFKQADSSATRRVGGLGLGLALVSHLVELHGGRVSATSRGVGHGASFRVVLPVRAIVQPRGDAVRSAAMSVPSAEGCSSGRDLQGVRVLVVDDEEDARELLSAAFSSAGGEVATAASASEGFEVFRRFRPAVIVSDIGMPTEDGYSFIQRVRELEQTEGSYVPALALTAYARNEDRVAAMTAGFTSHLGKPVEPEALLREVVSLVRSRGENTEMH
jgi:PAS domain S-box-containing protein